MKYTVSSLARAKSLVLSSTKNYEDAVNEYLKIQYVLDCRSEDAQSFNHSLRAMVKDGIRQEILDLYVLVCRFFKNTAPKDLNKFEKMNLWSLTNPKGKKSTKVEFGYRHVMKALCSLMAKAKKSRSKAAKQEVACLALLIKTTKQMSSK